MRWLTHGKWKQQDCESAATDYRTYTLSAVEYTKVSLVAAVITFAVAYLFYDSMAVFGILFFFVEFMMIRIVKKKMCSKRKKDLQLQFRDMCVAVSSGLTTGESFENAVINSKNELMQIHGDDCYIVKEINIIQKKLILSVPAEDIFEDLSMRSDIEDITTFSEILVIVKRTGGDLIGIMRKTADNIGDKIEMDREIASVINSRKYEQMIMNLVPLFIVLYMRITSPDVIGIMYSSMIGRIIMTVCLIIYVFALWLGDKVTDVDIV